MYAYHGVPDAEQAVGHRYVLDLELDVDGAADETDELAHTVDYASIARVAEACCLGTRFRTVERLASVIADRLLHDFPPVQSVAVTVAKPMPPAPIIADCAGVTLRRSRT